jgi:hypothetical protein
MTIELGKGSMQCPGTSDDSDCVETWETEETATKLTKVSQTSMPSRKISYSNKVEVEVTADGLQINGTSSTKATYDNFSCTLIRL